MPLNGQTIMRSTCRWFAWLLMMGALVQPTVAEDVPEQDFICGQILDTALEPVMGAQIRYEDSKRFIESETKGYFTLPRLRSTGFDLEIDAGDRGCAMTTIAPKGSQDFHTVFLEHCPTLHGVVLDQDDRPIEHAAVYLDRTTSSMRRDGSGRPSFGHVATTDGTGTFEIFGVPRGQQIRLEVWHDEFRTYEITQLVQVNDDVLDIHLEPMISITGQVFDFQQKPLEAVDLILMDTRSYAPIMVSADHEATSDIDGTFTFRRIEPGQYRVLASKNGFQWLEVPVSVGESSEFGTSTDLSLHLLEGATLEGYVVGLHDEPQANASVKVHRPDLLSRDLWDIVQTTMTDGNGRFEIGNLTPGSFVVEVTRQGVRVVQTLSIGLGHQTVVLDLETATADSQSP